MTRNDQRHSFSRPHNRFAPQFDNTRRAAELRREREIGNWGRASEHIGRRWEELGLRRLVAMLERPDAWHNPRHQPHALAPLMDDAGVQACIAQVSLPSPDVVIVVTNGDEGLALQALDFKWDLEFASYVQIRASALEALMQRDSGALHACLSRAAEGPAAGMTCVDGMLFAPDSPANQHFLASATNRRQEYPIEPSEVIFEPVDPEEFFSPLPAWEMALRLAELDRSPHSLKTLDGTERFYRLGAGLLGAVSQLRTSLFDATPAVVDAATAIDWLRPQVPVLASGMLIERVQRLMAVRSEQVARLRRLTRSPYRIPDFARALAARRIDLPERGDGPVPPERARWMEILRRVDAEYRAAVLRAGLRLVGDGLSDSDALTRLESNTAPFEKAARTLAERLIDARIRRGV